MKGIDELSVSKRIFVRCIVLPALKRAEEELKQELKEEVLWKDKLKV